ncbi:MAG: ComEC/Rec2 family competence protein [Patescibacteria group bacterium]|nr:ComEC/Rec2 family competence protein [Patescibacteria group bacterium]
MSVAILTFFLYTQYSKANTNTASTGNLVGPILKVYYFDVGQGDSIFIKTPEGKDILIDGGPDATVMERLGETLPYWDRTIDLMVLTHPHADHIQGLDDVLKNYKVGEVIETDLKNPTPEENYFNKLAGLTEIQKAVKGEKINLESDLDLQILYPFGLQVNEEDLNDDSIVLKMIYKGRSFLFTGDATTNVESKIEDQDLKADFLKVGHHGSRYASSSAFLEKVKPAVSIISVGAGNSFGHPTRDTLDRLSAVGSRVLRTDKAGTVEVDVGSNGEWVVSCSKGCN